MKRMLVALGLAVAAGCVGGFSEREAPPLIYRIDAPVLAAGDTLAADLLVAPPGAAPGLASSRIATRWPGHRMDYYAGARWAGELPDLVHAALTESLAGSRRLRSVQGDLGRFRATHVLTVELRRFEADYEAGGAPVARVVLEATLGRQSDRGVIAAFSVAAEQPAPANRLGEVVAALDAAFGRAATELSVRTVDAIADDLARR